MVEFNKSGKSHIYQFYFVRLHRSLVWKRNSGIATVRWMKSSIISHYFSLLTLELFWVSKPFYPSAIQVIASWPADLPGLWMPWSWRVNRQGIAYTQKVRKYFFPSGKQVAEVPHHHFPIISVKRPFLFLSAGFSLLQVMSSLSLSKFKPVPQAQMEDLLFFLC